MPFRQHVSATLTPRHLQKPRALCACVHMLEDSPLLNTEFRSIGTRRSAPSRPVAVFAYWRGFDGRSKEDRQVNREQRGRLLVGGWLIQRLFRTLVTMAMQGQTTNKQQQYHRRSTSHVTVDTR